jgi:sugar phosphate isomerase/epimerase
MNSQPLTRRQFLRTTTAIAAYGFLAPAAQAAAETTGARWPIGCFNRPWAKWSFDDALGHTKTAGYNLTGLLTRHREDPFVAPEATPEYLAKLKKRIAASGLSVNMAALRSRHNVPVEDSIKEIRQQIDNSARLELKYLLSFGVDQPAQFDHYYRVMADAAAYAEKQGIHIVMKPHGGGSGASEEILRCVEKVNHSNFKIWYDAGNIIHYTGKDPLAELEPVIKLVTGFCAKDCARQKGDVMIQFGDGKVDFKAIFKRLKAAGFNGPVMVECCAGQTQEEVTVNARANREFLEKIFASL